MRVAFFLLVHRRLRRISFAFRISKKCAQFSGRCRWTLIMAKAQKHHYIPRFYLKQWMGTDGFLCEFSRPYRDVVPRRVSPNATGYTKGLYTFSALPPHLANRLETGFLQRTDDLAHQALCELVTGNVRLDSTKRSAWSRFMMSLLHRNPERIAAIRQMVRRDLPATRASLWPEIERRFGSDILPEFERSIAALTDAEYAECMFSLLQICMDSREVGEHMNGMWWHVMNVSHLRYPLLTSDRPLVMTNGMKRADAHFAMPLSPTMLFIAANEHRILDKIVGTMGNARDGERMNTLIVQQAHRYVYGTNDTQLRFIQNRFGQRTRSTPLEELSYVDTSTHMQPADIA